MIWYRTLQLLLLTVAASVLIAARARKNAVALEDFEPGRVSFSVKFKGELNPYSVLGVYVMPLENIQMLVALGKGRSFVLEAEDGVTVRLGANRWLWHAPAQSGLFPLHIVETVSRETMTLNMFVMVPYNGEETLNGFRIGKYQEEPLRGNPAYARPRGFIEITPKNKNTHVSPHFKLSQFMGKQVSGYPKYVLLRERLLLKLEAVLERVNTYGWRIDTLHVMSAFRTPFYNESIGNSTTYSRHSYGDASDIFLDQDGDAVMDDIDQDGKIDVCDGEMLEDIIERLTKEKRHKIFAGGLHVYPAGAGHGPMVHVDTRGENMRW